MTNMQKDVYDYLLMRFQSISMFSKFQKSSLRPQLNQAYSYTNQKAVSILSLFISQEQIQLMSNQNVLQTKNKTKELYKVFLQQLIEYYPALFKSQNINDLNTQSQKIQSILFRIIVKYSILDIQSDTNTSLIQNLQDSSTISSAFLLFGTIFIKLKQQNEIYVSFQKFSSTLKQLVEDILGSQNDSTNLILKQLFNFFSHNFKDQLSQDQLSSKLIKSFNQFSTFYKIHHVKHKKQILDLHYLQQLLQQSTQIQKQWHITHCKGNIYNYNQNHPKIINMFNYFNINQNKCFRVNKVSLELFLKNPYLTSTFVLYTLLSQSGIKSLKYFFPQNKLIDPLLFLIIDTKLLNQFNSEIFSLSLWIVLDAWLQHVESIAKNKLQPNSNHQNLPDPAHIYNDGTHQDPRRIYTIKREAYPKNSIIQKQIQSKITIKTSHYDLKSYKDFDNQYTRRLMNTIIMFLLTLDFQTTILKYFPIQNDLFKQMMQTDIFPTLLVKNKYIFGNQKNKETLSNTKFHQNKLNYEQYLQQSINNASTLDEIEEIQRLVKNYQKKDNKIQNPQESNGPIEIQFGNYALPWMCLIESKQNLIQLLLKPYGYKLALQIIKTHPYTFQKTYQNHIPKLIFHQMEQKGYLSKTKHPAQISSYLLKGNKNVKMSKQIDYFKSIGNKSQNSLNKIRQEQSQQNLEAKKILLQLYKQKSKDEIIRKICSKFINLI